MRSFFVGLFWLSAINGGAVLFLWRIGQPRLNIAIVCGLLTCGWLLYVFVGKYSVITNFLIAIITLVGLVFVLYPLYPHTLASVEEKVLGVYMDDAAVSASLTNDINTYDVKSRLLVKKPSGSTRYSMKSVDGLTLEEKDTISYISQSEEGQTVKLTFVEGSSLAIHPQSQIELLTYTGTDLFYGGGGTVYRKPTQGRIEYENLGHIFSAKQYRIALPGGTLILREGAGEVFVQEGKVIVTPYMGVGLYIETKTGKKVVFEPQKAYLIDGSSIKTKKVRVIKEAQRFMTNQQARQRKMESTLTKELGWRLGSSEILQQIALQKVKYWSYIDPEISDDALRYYMNVTGTEVPLDEKAIPSHLVYMMSNIHSFASHFDSTISYLSYRHANETVEAERNEIIARIKKQVSN